MKINCPSLPDTLLESELFGCKKGALTDARKDKPGLILTANQGTLLLDEIGEMSLPLKFFLKFIYQLVEPLDKEQ